MPLPPLPPNLTALISVGLSKTPIAGNDGLATPLPLQSWSVPSTKNPALLDGAVYATLLTVRLPARVCAAGKGGSVIGMGAARYWRSFWLPLGRTASDVISST